MGGLAELGRRISYTLDSKPFRRSKLQCGGLRSKLGTLPIGLTEKNEAFTAHLAGSNNRSLVSLMGSTRPLA